MANFGIGTLALFYLMLSGPPALAQITGALPPTPTLKRDVTVTHDIVRIGDLIENAGARSQVPVFRAPDIGQTGTVPAARVIEAVRAHGYTIVDTNGVRDVAVTRASRVITAKDIEARITATLANQPGVGDVNNLTVTIERGAHSLVLEPNAGELQATRVYYDPRSSRFDVTFEAPGSAIARRLPPLRYSGTAVETVEAAIVARPVGRGDVIKAADIAIERRPKAEIRGDIVRTIDEVAGLAARRALRAGEPLRMADLTKPEIVRRNEAVTLVYEAPGLMLTIKGKALESGAQGDVINVANIQSKRTVQGTVTGPGQVTLASSRPVARATTATASEPTEPSPNE